MKHLITRDTFVSIVENALGGGPGLVSNQGLSCASATQFIKQLEVAKEGLVPWEVGMANWN